MDLMESWCFIGGVAPGGVGVDADAVEEAIVVDEGAFSGFLDGGMGVPIGVDVDVTGVCDRELLGDFGAILA